MREISIDRLSAIIELVQLGKVPDGTYSDDECTAWEMIRRTVTDLVYESNEPEDSTFCNCESIGIA
jgi:hypothetical protein